MENNNFPKNISINENLDNYIINEKDTFEYKYNQIKPKVKTISISEVKKYSYFNRRRKRHYNILNKINEKKKEKKEKKVKKKGENNIKREYNKGSDDKLIKTNTNSQYNFLVRKISRDEYFSILNKKNIKPLQKEEKDISCIKSVPVSNTISCLKSVSDKCIKSTGNKYYNDFDNYSPKYYHNKKKA